MNGKWKEPVLIVAAILTLVILIAGAWENALASDSWQHMIGHVFPAFIAILLVAIQIHRLVRGNALIAWSFLLLTLWLLLTVHITLSTLFQLPPGGYRLFGLQPDLLLGSLLMVGIAAGLVSLYTLQVKLRWFGLIIIALCLYGLAGIGFQLFDHSSLFEAPEYAPALPALLSGASLTVFLTLPLLLILGLYLRFAKERVTASGNTVLGLILTASVAGLAAFPFSSTGETNWTVLAGTSDPAVAQDRIAAAIAEVVENYKPEPLTVDRVIEETGRDAESIFRWVRDNTHYVPYRGALRGAPGVLSDRLGNSLDRALLLAALLRKAGHQVRFSRGTIAADQSQLLLAGSFEQLSNRAPEALPPLSLTPELRSILERHQIDIASVESAVIAEEGRAGQIQDELERRTADIADYILDEVSAQSVLASARLADGTDHWWISIREGARWIPMDPSDRQSVPGDHLATEHRSFDTVPESEYHTVKLDLVIEVLSRDGLNESVLISRTFNTVGLGNQPIRLRHLPVDWPGTEHIAAAEDPIAETRSVLLANKEWTPVISVGNASAISKWFSTSGMIFDSADFNPNTTRLGKVLGMATEKTVGSATDLFGTLPGGLVTGKTTEDESVADSRDTFVTAEWLVFSIHRPDEKPVEVRRQIFDLIGPAARSAGTFSRSLTEEQELHRALALMGNSEVLVANSAPDTGFIGQQIQSQQQAALSALAGKDTEDFSGATGFTWPLSSLRLSIWPSRHPVYLAAPNILAFHLVPTLENGVMGTLQAYDIVFNEVVPLTDTSVISSRIRQGVLDTVAESLLLPFCRGNGTIDCERIVNASEDFRGTEWKLLKGLGDLDEAEYPEGSAARQRVRDALESGHFVLAPEDERTADVWWELDPITGTLLGYGPNGWGIAMSEHAILAGIAIGSHLNCVWSTINSARSATSTGDGIVTAVDAAVCTVESVTSVGFAVYAHTKLEMTKQRALLLAVGVFKTLWDGAKNARESAK